jgi:DNA-directed RNA polymerase specialized sigma24 family protein/DNA-binding MarR family transcriptional regulator
MEDLLRRRANLDRIADFETKLKQNASRLRALEYFTGGNPRLALMLYRVVSRSDVTEVRRALEKLLDEVTPYYKAKVETLPPQQRKILDHIARVSGETNEGLTPGEIAPAVRLSPNQVSSQLKRLSELGYVRPANLRGRSSCYALSEPLYAIWHQMRFGRDARERMGWLVSFLKIWYAADEFGPESERLDARFREYFGSDRSQEAYDVLEHHHYLVRAMKDTSGQAEVMNRLIGSYLVYGDTTTVKNELLLDVRLADLSGDTINKLYETGCINAEQFDLVKAFKYSSDQSLDTATNFSHTEETQVAEHAFDKLLETLNPDRDLAGEAYVRLRYKLIAYFRRRGSTFPEDLADDTLDRVARRLFRGGIIITNLDAYCLGVAKYVLLEYGRESMRKVDLTEVSEIEVYWGEPEERIAHDQRLECFQRCLQQLSPSDRELLIQYYEGDQSAKVENRELIAAKLGITLPSLRVRVYRLRAKMEACAKKCLEVRRRTEVTRYLPDDWGELARFLTQQFRSGQYEQQNTSVEYRNVFAANDSQEARIHEQMKDLIAVLRAGNFNLARRLIIESNLEEQLFPLARAIDYLQTGDEALIEKLSPEVRGIVEEVVAKLKTVSCEQRTDDQPA